MKLILHWIKFIIHCYTVALGMQTPRCQRVSIFILFLLMNEARKEKMCFSGECWCSFVVFSMRHIIDDIKLLNFLLLAKQTTNCIVLIIVQCVGQICFSFICVCLAWLATFVRMRIVFVSISRFIHYWIMNTNGQQRMLIIARFIRSPSRLLPKIGRFKLLTAWPIREVLDFYHLLPFANFSFLFNFLSISLNDE